jgi:Arc/MetJ family transcription regulator
MMTVSFNSCEPILKYGPGSHVVICMKTRIEIDERRLARVMQLTGIRTKTQAVDFALRAAERIAMKRQLLSTVLREADLEGAVDPVYDVLELGDREVPDGR